MEPFLEKVSEYIFDNYKENLSDLSIVLPNKRAGLFVKKYLSGKFRRNIWSPQIFSIDEFMAELSGMTVSEPVSLLFELYRVYKKAEGEKAQTPIEFMRWAPVLLSDFNEIDSYCADSADLFNYLNEIRGIELWDPARKGLSEFQQQYLNFWKSLATLYHEFSGFLRSNNTGYQGLLYRIAVEKILAKDKSCSEKIKGNVIFAGFNALTKAEEMVIGYFLNLNRAKVFWDADEYYLKNKNQEAGKFLRNYLNQEVGIKSSNLNSGISQPEFDEVKASRFFFPKSSAGIFPFCKELEKGSKSIEVIAVSGNIIQAKVAGDILNKLKISSGNNSEALNTAVVLADESLLIPVLNSIPASISGVNITMGFSLKNSPVYDFWNSVFNLHDIENTSSATPSFYHKNIIRVLSHPFLLSGKTQSGVFSKIISEIKQKNKIFVSGKELEKMAVPFTETDDYQKISPLFSNWKNNPATALGTIIEILKYKLNEQNFESEILSRFLEVFLQLQLIQEKYKLMADIKTLKAVYNQMALSYSVPFSGEPLTGLQIMGMLETRTLDFETVILLSANEEILPSGKKQNSFIPFDIKKQFGLPTYSDRDAIFAYHFYRLIQRAKKIFILYNNDISKNSGFGGTEKSRFITQIQEELPKINPNIIISEKIHSFNSASSNNYKLKIVKNALILNRLDEISQKGFSPTSINTYLNCPLDFYFQYIVGIREEQEVEESIDAAVFGDFIHQILQKIFLPFLGKVVSIAELEILKKGSLKITESVFLEKYSRQDISFGKNLLTLKVAEKLVRSFLNKEIDYLNKLKAEGNLLTILELEKELEIEFNVEGKKLKFRGKADRIDRVGQTIRIIDYKTGSIISSELKIDSPGISAFEKPKPKALQLLMYAMMYYRSMQTVRKSGTERIASGIVSLRKLSQGFMPLTIGGAVEIENPSFEIFENELKKIVSEIYNPTIPFEHTPGSKYCKFCKE